MNQRERLKNLIIAFCNDEGCRSFTLQQLHERYGDYSCIGIGGKTPQATVRRLLQELGDQNHIRFGERSGNYTINLDLLAAEQSELATINISQEIPDTREYLMETYVRKVKWALMAIERFGCYCLFDGCSNSFKREDGTSYIEVHHIIPLWQGGEDALGNLSILCAHHHRMAHCADFNTVNKTRKFLLDRNEQLLKDIPDPVEKIQ